MTKCIEAKLSADPVPEDVEEIAKTILARDCFDIPLRIHRPKAALNDSPLIVYYHFGGYCVGSPALTTPICR